MKKTIIAALAASAIVAALAVPGMVNAKRRASADQVSSVAIMQSDPHLGDWVTFQFSAPSDVRYPRIQVMCYQDGVLVYGAADTASAPFELGGGSSDWRNNGGGEADCEATLYSWDFKPVQTFISYATTSFHAGDWR